MVYTQYRSFFLSSTTFPTFHVCYYSTHGSVLLILPLADGFHGLRTVLLSGWWRLVHSSIRQRLSSRFARSIAPQLAADCSYFRSSPDFTMVACHIALRMAPCCLFLRLPSAFTVCAPYCSEDVSGLRILSFVNCFSNTFLRILLSRW